MSVFCKSESNVLLNIFKTNEAKGIFNSLVYLFCPSISVQHRISNTTKCSCRLSTVRSSNQEPHQESCLNSRELLTKGSVSDLDNQGVTRKLVKVAVVGTPNAGKSTFINRLVERRVCSISSKVHTTRTKSKAILNEGITQIVFLDTPGLVNAKESKRHNLEKSFLVDAELSSEESDLVVVIHDASNVWTRDRLDVKVSRLLHLHQKKPSILVLNKVDLMKSKRKLLDLSQSLTCGSLKIHSPSHVLSTEEPSGQSLQLANGRSDSLSEKEVEKYVKETSGWPYFEGVFMVSALAGSGMDAVKEYILQKGIPRPWIYPPQVFTDQKREEIIVLAVQEKLMECLPKEVPYNVVTELEHMTLSHGGDVCAVVLIRCAHLRHEKMVIGTHGRTIREIARSAEHALKTTFFEDVKLKIVVEHRK